MRILTRHVRVLPAAFLVAWLHATSAFPQEMAVYTTVSAVEESNTRPRLIARSLTLFHAGKVYDYMEDVGEVVILEPVANRFTILDARSTATRVEFSELNQFLSVARVESERYLEELSGRSDSKSAGIAKLLRFQLDPDFRDSGDPADGRFVLSSPVMRYDVQTAPAPDKRTAEQYLTYADWAARLNFVLHPRSSYPEPRLHLNEQLRKKSVLPIVVQLETHGPETVLLRAEHKFQWELQAADRAHIHEWERLLESDRLRWLSFHEYQQHLLAQAKKAGR